MPETVQMPKPPVGADQTRREYTPPTLGVTPLDRAVRWSFGSVTETDGPSTDRV
jgi:hypothetical protein